MFKTDYAVDGNTFIHANTETVCVLSDEYVETDKTQPAFVSLVELLNASEDTENANALNAWIHGNGFVSVVCRFANNETTERVFSLISSLL
jgi:hypothetical protein